VNCLFASDLHDDENAYVKYVNELKKNYYNFGIISGDLCDYSYELKEIRKAPGVNDDDLLEELYDPDDTVEELNDRVEEYRRNPNTPLAKYVEMKEKKLKDLLKTAKKPIFIIPGNHDISYWKSEGRIHNVHNKCYRYRGYRIIGYRYTRLEVSETEERQHLSKLESKMKGKVILVTHAPAYGILDKSYRGISIGSVPILEILKKHKVLLHLFGHVHHSFGFENSSINGAYPIKKMFISIKLPDLVIKEVNV
jgi:Icc-related predicted phosphoesterase